MAQPADSEQTQANLYNGRCFRARLCHRARHNSRGYGGFVALRLLHFADLHLDRSFAGERLYGVGAQRRREDLRIALQRIVERARQAEADLITCAGDLFEQHHVTRETASFVLQTLGAAGRPVLIAPGHADPAVPSSPYRYLRWPTNVTVATHEELRPYHYGDVQIWAAGFMRPEVPEAPLRDFVRQEGGIPLLLLHASDMSQMPEGVTPSKPILPARWRRPASATRSSVTFTTPERASWSPIRAAPNPWAGPSPAATVRPSSRLRMAAPCGSSLTTLTRGSLRRRR